MNIDTIICGFLMETEKQYIRRTLMLCISQQYKVMSKIIMLLCKYVLIVDTSGIIRIKTLH